jgi:hypothetical protein
VFDLPSRAIDDNQDGALASPSPLLHPWSVVALDGLNAFAVISNGRHPGG